MKKLLISLILIIPTLTLASNDYWILKYKPVEVRGIRLVEYPCRELLLGCFQGGYIEIKKDLSHEITKCILTHELKHAAGWWHDDRKIFALDCGDGTMYIYG